MSDTADLPFRPFAPGTQPPLDSPGYRSTAKRHPNVRNTQSWCGCRAARR